MLLMYHLLPKIGLAECAVIKSFQHHKIPDTLLIQFLDKIMTVTTGTV